MHKSPVRSLPVSSVYLPRSKLLDRRASLGNIVRGMHREAWA